MFISQRSKTVFTIIYWSSELPFNIMRDSCLLPLNIQAINGENIFYGGNIHQLIDIEMHLFWYLIDWANYPSIFSHTVIICSILNIDQLTGKNIFYRRNLCCTLLSSIYKNIHLFIFIVFGQAYPIQIMIDCTFIGLFIRIYFWGGVH